MGALVAGVLAGLAIAVPLGAIGVLLITEGLRRGHASAAAAAFGVATVDLVYATLALLAGTLVSSLLTGRETTVKIVAALVLLAIGLRGMIGALRTDPAKDLDDTGSREGKGVMGAFWRFFGLTAINPLTALYFVALAAGLGGRMTGPGSGLLFVTGVFLGSVSWQLVLGLGGAFLGPRLGPGLRRGTAVFGYGLVVAMAVALGVSAFAT